MNGVSVMVMQSDEDARTGAGVDAGGRIRVVVDDMLLGLIPDFLEMRRQDVMRLRALLVSEAFCEIERLGHNMKGNGASYGFAPITDIGQRLEAAARLQHRVEIVALTEALASYLARIEVVGESGIALG